MKNNVEEYPKYEVGKTYEFYCNASSGNFVTAHVLSVVPHPHDKDLGDLITFAWYGKNRNRWFYSVTDSWEQNEWKKVFNEYSLKCLNKNY